MKGRNNRGQFCPATADDIAAVTIQFLNSAILLHGVRVIADALDIPADTLAGYRKGRPPCAANLVRLTAFFGGGYTRAIIAHAEQRQRVQTEATPYANASPARP